MSRSEEIPPAAAAVAAELSDEAIFFLAESARHTRELPVDDSIRFLEGCAACMKEGSAVQAGFLRAAAFFKKADWCLDQLANAALQPEETKKEE